MFFGQITISNPAFYGVFGTQPLLCILCCWSVLTALSFVAYEHNYSGGIEGVTLWSREIQCGLCILYSLKYSQADLEVGKVGCGVLLFHKKHILG